MLKHWRKVLLLTALCWVVPASAELSTEIKDACPFSHGPQTVMISASGGVGEVPVSAAERAYYP